MDDLIDHKVDILTLGQYPIIIVSSTYSCTFNHLPVEISISGFNVKKNLCFILFR